MREKTYSLNMRSMNASEAGETANAETLYLLAVPGMRESIKEGLRIPVEDCDEEPGW